MPVQQHAPIRSGLPPLLTSFTILLPSPIAAIAIVIRNLLRFLSGANTLAETPADVQLVYLSTPNLMLRDFVFISQTAPIGKVSIGWP